jgi:hypothetical protein
MGTGHPAPEPGEDWLQLHPPVGLLVDPRRRGRGKLAASHDPGLLQPAQSLGEDVGARARQARLKVREALGPQQQLADDQERPALSHEVEGVRRRAPIIVRAPLRCARGFHTRDFITGSFD